MNKSEPLTEASVFDESKTPEQSSPDNIVKRKRGRPKGSKNSSTISQKGNNTPIKQATAKSSEAINPAIFANAFETIVSLIDERLEKVNVRIAYKITKDKSFATNVGVEGRLTVEEKKAIKTSAGNLASKYDVLNKFGDEFILAAVLASYGYRQISLQNDLRKLATANKDVNTSSQN